MRLFMAIMFVVIFAAVPARAQGRLVQAGALSIRVEVVARGLEHPWSLAFLPGGDMLVTERPGRLRRIARDGTLSPPLAGLPAIFARGQGGLLDIALGPDFSATGLVYFAFAEPGPGGASTAVARGRLAAAGLEDVSVIFRQLPKVDGNNHWGARLAFAPDGTLFIGMGDRYKFQPAQDPGSHIGKIVRINPDGSVPPGNPFAGRADARPEIWSLGHRNIQGMAIHPGTGVLWSHEMGPRGGDELNIPKAGANHGWPLVSWGTHYNLEAIPLPPTRPDLTDAIHQWTPVIAPSGMAFYTGDAFPGWQGSLLIGGLQAGGIGRVSLDGERVAGEERIRLNARIRDVRQGPDGMVYALVDAPDGVVLRLSPAR
jgi:glucose/arabinose dehydrogenase